MLRRKTLVICMLVLCAHFAAQGVNRTSAAISSPCELGVSQTDTNAPYVEIHSPEDNATYETEEGMEQMFVTLDYSHNVSSSRYFLEVLGYTATGDDLAVFIDEDYVGALGITEPKLKSFWTGQHNLTVLAGAYGSGYPNTTARQTVIFNVVDPATMGADSSGVDTTSENDDSICFSAAAISVAVVSLSSLCYKLRKRRSM